MLSLLLDSVGRCDLLVELLSSFREDGFQVSVLIVSLVLWCFGGASGAGVSDGSVNLDFIEENLLTAPRGRTLIPLELLFVVREGLLIVTGQGRQQLAHRVALLLDACCQKGCQTIMSLLLLLLTTDCVSSCGRGEESSAHVHDFADLLTTASNFLVTHLLALPGWDDDVLIRTGQETIVFIYFWRCLKRFFCCLSERRQNYVAVMVFVRQFYRLDVEGHCLWRFNLKDSAHRNFAFYSFQICLDYFIESITNNLIYLK